MCRAKNSDSRTPPCGQSTMRLLVLLSIACFLPPSPAIRADETVEPALSKSMTTYLEQNIAPYVQRGDSLAIVSQLSPLVARMKPADFRAVDKQFREWNLPSAESVLLDARLTLLQQGLADQLPRMGAREALATAREINRRIQALIADIGKNALLQDPLPAIKTLSEFERGFWDLHVFENELRSMSLLANYGDQISKKYARRKKESREESEEAGEIEIEPADALDVDFLECHRRLEKIYDDLQQRKIELRVNRCEFAYNLLKSGGSFIDRLQAAYWLDLDGELITSFFSQPTHPIRVTRAKLQDPNLANQIRTKVEFVRREYGDTVTRGQWLFVGLHFWLRGRYGAGTDGYGLLKPVSAIDSDQAAFGLFMPVDPPIPSDPLALNSDNSYQPPIQIPTVDRRHHYIWMYEYRQFFTQTQFINRKSTTTDKSVVSQTTFKQFY